jgi:hypothetical protein
MKQSEMVMVCANPKCRCELFDMPGGSIWLLQLELPGDHATGTGEEAFSAPTSPEKYFWLCAACSRRFVLWRWTPSGIFLAQRRPGVRYRNVREMDDASNPFRFSVHASVQIEEEFLDLG